MDINIDFETFCQLDLRKVGVWKYANHDSADIICLSWSYDDGEPYLWHPTSSNGDEDLFELFKHIESGNPVWAYNAGFEWMMWNYCAVRKYGWPKLKMTQLHDTMAIAQSRSLPGPLDKCGAALGLDVTKDSNGKRLINKLSKPRRPSKHNPATRWTPELAPEDFAQFYDYCKQDVRSERAIHNRLKAYELRPFEREMWLVTLLLNDKGVPVDVDLVKSLIHLIASLKSDLEHELIDLTNGLVITAGQRDRIIDFIHQESGILLDDLTKDTVAAELENGDPNTLCRRVLEIRQILSKSSTKKFDRILRMADDDGCVHDILRYHQATTGRWGGTGIQIHNLPRTKVPDVDTAVSLVREGDLELIQMFNENLMDFASAMIRPSICAKPGHVLVVSDFSGIENRVLCWLADDRDALRLFAKGIEQYRWFATKLYPGVEYDDVTKEQRAHAKTCILGLGYGMGAEKFLATCLGYGMDVDLDECRQDVDLYRQVYQKVVTFWYHLHDAAFATVAYGRDTRCGHIGFTLEDEFLNMHLPSGRKIAYYQPEIQKRMAPWGEMKDTITYMGSDPKTFKWIRTHTTPGKLAENATQAVARDILASAKHRLMLRGYNVIFSVHDEIVAHEKEGTKSLDEFNTIMCETNEKIYPGLPIAAEGYIAQRYRKD